MNLPALYTVIREPFEGGGTDPHGTPVETWGPPQDVVVHGWAPPSGDDPSAPGRTDVVRDLDLYCPPGAVGAPRDKWIVDGAVYSQVGWPDDFTHGPWGWAAGVRINLLRVEG